MEIATKVMRPMRNQHSAVGLNLVVHSRTTLFSLIRSITH